MRSLLSVFLFICLSPFLVKSLNSTLNDDVLGLIVFKSDIEDPLNKLSTWNEDDVSPCKNWAGVKCNPNGVSELVLDGLGLSGKLGRGLLRLNFLQKLSLAKNNLTGSLSLNFSQLPYLRVLDLSENGLSGSIPSDFFSQCGSLRSISLDKNEFSGTIPDSLSSCSSLTSLSLSGNQFSGSLPLGIWSIPALGSLDLSDNLLGGEIPTGIEGLTNLSMISLRNNQFSGAVPDGIGNCDLLKSIDLSRNKLYGEIPNTMQKLSFCRDLVLSGNGFKSDVPEWIGEMRSLEVLDLSENSFSGKIPDSFANLQSLKILNVSENDLTGNIPSWLFRLGLEQVRVSGNGLSGTLDDAFALSTEDSQKKLVILDLSQNKFYGAIPAAVGDFGSLKFLSMATNSFVGNIPENIGLIKTLNILDLSENQLNGSIPSEIGELASLKSLYLAHNNIMGPISDSLANLSYLETVDLSFNKLSGTLPRQLSNLVNLKSFNISHNQLQGELPLGGFFNTIDSSSVSGNPLLCGAVLKNSCARDKVLPKPIVLDPNSTDPTNPNAINSPSFRRGKKVLSVSSLIAICAAIAIVVGVIFISVLNLRVRSTSGSRSVRSIAFSGGADDDDLSRSSPSSDGSSGKLVMFSGHNPDFRYTGAHALLDKDRELGRGGFGSVYRAGLGDGRSVAIKKLAVSSLIKSQEDFEMEVEKLGKVRDHANLVSLDGYYWTPSLQLLIYEFVPGGNLYKHLHESRSGGNYLSWNERFSIILGTAKGLAHLHKTNIIHYNLKSSNVMIDSTGEPKVADYGLARLLPMLDRYVLSSKIQSALGYMAPEFACKTVKITEKCDVYGFGALVLEIVTGKRPVEYMEDDVVVLCDMIRGALEEGIVEECVDGKLQGKFPVEEAIPVMKLGLICMSQVPSNRPDMAEVVNILELIRCPSERPDELGDYSPDC
ncbi:probably inactive leucine-rich repeat receptor-like protein kinase at3g28040 [Phtheirospermum japonicum]|uniref:Probably inactive leucine-rich repeat receptor-like protein kinase at3g28040 n=1 Tax=Phtheirospermum japonicum TaxID=374723 RepID=A0A830D7B8_9LAMI|nr:probably inactive leucine-rich repeat receptor-like protein kinase at3g28040 [Phtheirospermum japonicum]